MSVQIVTFAQMIYDKRLAEAEWVCARRECSRVYKPTSRTQKYCSKICNEITRGVRKASAIKGEER